MRNEVSVLIPTLGREQVLIDTVQSLLTQTVLPQEIIIVDQNQPPLPQVDQFLASIPRVRHIRSSRTGVVFNMNIALREAKTEIVLFVDDDIIPKPDLIEMHLLNYEHDSKYDAVSGRVLQPSGDLPQEKISKVGYYCRFTGIVLAHFNSNVRQEVMLAPAGNMSLRRELLAKISGFDIGFLGNGYFFESDMSLRFLAAGYKIIFDPKAEVQHLQAPSGGCRIHDKALHHYYFVRNGLRLFRRHSPLLALPFFLVKTLAYSAAKAVYNQNFRIFFKTLSAIWEGLTQPMKVQSNFGEKNG